MLSSITDPKETKSDCSALEHPFAFATTEILPPELPTMVEIILVVEVPVHPLGNVHV